MVCLPIHWRETEAQRYKMAWLSHYNAREQSLACWCMPIISVQEQLRQEDCHQLGANLKYIVSSRPARNTEQKGSVSKKQGNENISRSRLEVFQRDVPGNSHTGASFSGQPHLCQCTHLPPNSWMHQSPALRLTLPDTCLCVGVWDLHRYACHMVTKMLGTHTASQMQESVHTPARRPV